MIGRPSLRVRRRTCASLALAIIAVAGTVAGPAQALAPTPVFAPYVKYEVGQAKAVAIGDFTGDGRNDALVSSHEITPEGSPEHAYLFVQGPDGWFNRKDTLDTGRSDFWSDRGLAAGDLDGDGLTDAVVATGTSVDLFFQRAGHLVAGEPLPVAGIDQVEVADLDRDGRADLVANGAAGLSVLRGQGAGAFGAPVTITAQQQTDVQVGDVTGDGRPDLVTCKSAISVYPQLSGGGFGARAQYSGDAPCKAVAIGDVNGDGRPDMSMVGTNDRPRLDVFTQLQGGGFPDVPTTYRTYFNPGAVKAADVNADGRQDLVVLHESSGAVGVHAQAPDHTLDDDRLYGSPGNDQPESLAVGDVNGDGRPDIVVADDRLGLVVLWGQRPGPSTTTSTMKLATTVPTTPPTGSTAPLFSPEQAYDVGGRAMSVASGDFNGDGRTDLAIATVYSFDPNTSEKLFVFYQGADGSLLRAARFDTEGSFAGRSDLMALAAGDLDGDGRTDLVLRMQEGVNIFMQRGGAFADRTFLELPYNLRVDIADLDGDGMGDLVMTGFGITVHRSLGAGRFAPPTTVSTTHFVDQMAVGDVTGDGRPDLVTADGVPPGFVVVFAQQADGSFGTGVRTSAGGTPGMLTMGDFSGDGQLDVAVSYGSDYKGGIRILTQSPAGTLVPAGDISVKNPGPLRAGDVNGDGRTDLVAVYGGPIGVGVLLQGVDGRLGAERMYPFRGAEPYTSTGVVLADFTGDGRLDLAAANRGQGLDVLRNSSGVQPDRDTDRFHSQSPRRILDTRAGVGAPAARLGPGGTVGLQVAGAGGIPTSGVSAVALNVTVTEPSAGSFLTAWPSGSPRPMASNLNYSAGQTVANLVVAKVGADGRINFFNNAGSTHVVADVAGWYGPGSMSPGAPYHPVSPTRILDTRSSTGAQPTTVEPSGLVSLQFAGWLGVPESAISAVVLNVTVTNPTAIGYLTAWPDTEAQPVVSNLNFAPGQTVANLVVVKVGYNGRVLLFNSAGTTDVIVDVAGWYGPEALGIPGSFSSLEPARILDTRVALGAPAATLGPGATLDLQVIGRGGVPASGVSAVVLNVTVTEPSAGSFLTAWPAGTARPLASNLNYRAGQTVANLVVVKVGEGGRVALYNYSGSAHVIADVAGWYTT